MRRADATEIYLSQIYAGPAADAEQQLRWIARIEQAQRHLNSVIAACPAVWDVLAQQLRAARDANRLTRVVARCTDAEQLAAHVDALLDCLHGANAAAHTVEQHLESLRLRTEISAALLSTLVCAPPPGEPVTPAQQRAWRSALHSINHFTELLVQANQRLIASVARQYRNGPLAFMDLVQEGNLGLLRAIERFDPARGTRLSTYALWWVRRAMVYAIARQGQTVRPSVAQYWEARHLLRATERLVRERKRHASQGEAAHALGVSVASLHQAMSLQTPSLPLDAPIANTDSMQVMDRLADAEQQQPEHSALMRDLNQRVRELLARLPERHAKILRMRFGIDVRDDCTLEQIAQQQGVTRERIRQLEAQALKALRELEETWQLQEALR